MCIDCKNHKYTISYRENLQQGWYVLFNVVAAISVGRVYTYNTCFQHISFYVCLLATFVESVDL